MEQTPLSLQQHEILMVKAVEPGHVVVDVWRVLYRHGIGRTRRTRPCRLSSRGTS
jgi:hypothetical protein